MEKTQIFNNFFDFDKFVDAISDRVAMRLKDMTTRDKAEGLGFSAKEISLKVGLSYPQFRKNFVNGLYGEAIWQIGSVYYMDEGKFACLKIRPRKRKRC